MRCWSVIMGQHKARGGKEKGRGRRDEERREKARGRKRLGQVEGTGTFIRPGGA